MKKPHDAKTDQRRGKDLEVSFPVLSGCFFPSRLVCAPGSNVPLSSLIVKWVNHIQNFPSSIVLEFRYRYVNLSNEKIRHVPVN